jgi:hypothetical protein
VARGLSPFGDTAFLAQLGNELGHAAQPAEVQERKLSGGRFWRGRIPVIGPTLGKRSAGAVRQPDDDVRLSPAAYANHFAALPPQRVMRMDNRDESQRRLGFWCSVL